MSVSPQNYTDWKAWARALNRELEAQEQANLVNVSTWVWDTTKPRNGMPPAVKGDLIRILKNGETFLGCFNGTSWDLFAREPEE